LAEVEYRECCLSQEPESLLRLRLCCSHLSLLEHLLISHLILSSWWENLEKYIWKIKLILIYYIKLTSVLNRSIRMKQRILCYTFEWVWKIFATSFEPNWKRCNSLQWDCPCCRCWRSSRTTRRLPWRSLNPVMSAWTRSPLWTPANQFKF